MKDMPERIIPPTMREVIITLRELEIDEKGLKKDVVGPYEVKAVVLKNDFTKWDSRDVKEEITKKACDCLGLLHNAIIDGTIEL